MTCSAEEQICPALESGTPGFEYKVDTTYDYYINNWYVDMDLVCANKAHTNSMLVPYYIASGLAGVMFLPMPDRLGRKFTIVLFLGVQLFAQYMAIFVPLYGARMAAFILYGLSQLRTMVMYIWMTEFVESRHVAAVNTSLTSFDSATMGVVCFYLLFIGRDIEKLFILMALLASAAFLVCAFVTPESPKWLLSVRRREDAIGVLNYIAKLNGSKTRIPLNARFKEEDQID